MGGYRDFNRGHAIVKGGSIPLRGTEIYMRKIQTLTKIGVGYIVPYATLLLQSSSNTHFIIIHTNIFYLKLHFLNTNFQ